MKKLKLGFLSSHGGSNMQAIIDACNSKELNMEPVVVISNNSRSKALIRANDEGIPYFHLSSSRYPKFDDLDSIIKDTLCEYEVDIVILAGYMKKIGDKTLNEFKNRILNIHPALLPNYGGKGMYGMNVHKAVIANNEKESGVTLHLVDGEYDHGRILNQAKVPVLKGDTPESLQERVLEREHTFYVETLKMIAKDEIGL